MLLDTSGLLCLLHQAESFHHEACRAYHAARIRLMQDFASSSPQARCASCADGAGVRDRFDGQPGHRSGLLEDRHEMRVRSGAVLLQPGADSPQFDPALSQKALTPSRQLEQVATEDV